MKIKETRKVFKRFFAETIKNGSDAILDEAAFPAYAHTNPLIDKIFWDRLASVEKYIDSKLPEKNGKILDYGCGSGVMSHCLGLGKRQVVAYDIIMSPARMIQNAIGFPAGVVLEDNKESLRKQTKSFDCILALDVLEHVENLNEEIDFLSALLKPEGSIIISGPTENILYKIGRSLAGSRFTGSYHKSDIGRIATELKKYGRVENIKTIYPVLNLFEIISFKPKNI